MRDDRAYLEYIEESIERIETYLSVHDSSGDGRERLDDPLIEDAVLRRLETLSDATGHLSPELKARHPTIELREITKFRNVLAHGYAHVDMDLVWNVISHGIGPLKDAVKREIEELGYLP